MGFFFSVFLLLVVVCVRFAVCCVFVLVFYMMMAGRVGAVLWFLLSVLGLEWVICVLRPLLFLGLVLFSGLFLVGRSSLSFARVVVLVCCLVGVLPCSCFRILCFSSSGLVL